MNRLERVRTHIRENKTAYIAGTVGVLVGATATVIVCKKVPVMQSQMTRIFSPGDNNLVQIYLPALGDPGNVVQCIEDKTTYASQGSLARALDVNKSVVSKHLNGKIPDLFGKHYEVLGKAGQPVAG